MSRRMVNDRWLPVRLQLLAVADAREQFADFLANGDSSGFCDSWLEYVCDLREWEQREGLTTEYMARLLDHDRSVRVARRMSLYWFAEAARCGRDGL